MYATTVLRMIPLLLHSVQDDLHRSASMVRQPAECWQEAPSQWGERQNECLALPDKEGIYL